MSSIPDVPLELLADLAGRFGIKVLEHPKGTVMERDGLRYRLIPFEGFVRGSQLREACHCFEIDPFDFISTVPNS